MIILVVLLRHVALPKVTYIRITPVLYELTWKLFHICKRFNKGCFTAPGLCVRDQWTVVVDAVDTALLAE